jgi:hypothetical protein
MAAAAAMMMASAVGGDGSGSGGNDFVGRRRCLSIIGITFSCL